MQRLLPFRLVEIEAVGTQRPVDRGAGPRRGGDIAPRAVEVGDRVEPMGANLVRLMIERDPGIGQIVEQGFQPLVIERQPMLHADIAAPGADRFVERVVGAGGAELLAVALAETMDRRVVEQHLADRAQHHFTLAAGRALAQRVEAAHAFERVAEEIEAQRLGRPRRVEIDDPAAHRELAGLAHRVGADVAIVAEEALQPVEPDPPPRPQGQHPSVEQLTRRHPLDQRVDRGQYHQRRFGGGRSQPGQGVDAAAENLAIGRHPVIGQAIPGREGQRLDPRLKKPEYRGKARHPAIVAAHMQPAPGPARGNEPADERRVVALGGTEQGDGTRPLGQRAGELVELAHAAGGAQLKASSRRITSWS